MYDETSGQAFSASRRVPHELEEVVRLLRRRGKISKLVNADISTTQSPNRSEVS